MSEPIQRRDILTIAEVAEELQVSTSHIAKLCQEGKLPHFRVSPRVIRIRRAALEEHIKQGEKGA